jgi:glycerate kinase
MNKIVIAPDKFKDSLSATEVCEHIAIGIRSVIRDVQIETCPLADGGEGTLALLSKQLSLKSIDLIVSDPLFRNITASYAISADQEQAYIEMALASGLPLLTAAERNPLKTSTYGTGELIKGAISQGVKKITLFIGGSATNDGGMGMAAALGYRFLDSNGKELQPTGANLIRVSGIDNANVLTGLPATEFVVATDVTNRLTGNTGAAAMYAAQKGAGNDAIEQLERGMAHFANIVQDWHGLDKSLSPGAGAAGGLGFGAMVFLNAALNSGIDTVIEIVSLNKKLDGADLVISGEGNLDEQSLHGKVIDGVRRLASDREVLLGVVCGGIQLSSRQLEDNGIKFSRSLTAMAGSASEAIARAGYYTELAAAAMIRDVLGRGVK